MLEMVYPNEKAKEIQEIYSYVSIVMDYKIITWGCLTLKIKKKKSYNKNYQKCLCALELTNDEPLLQVLSSNWLKTLRCLSFRATLN